MSLCVCACLNVCVRAPAAALATAPARSFDGEQRDAFFCEELLSCPSSSLKLEVSQPALTTQRQAGKWLIHTCLACGQTTHAERQDNPTADVLINKATLSTHEAVETLKSSPNFSPVFKLLVPEVSLDNDTKENMDINAMLPGVSHTVGILGKQLSRALQSELEAIEESVRLFRDKKYAEFEDYRERAHRDHKILASIVSRARVSADEPPFSQLVPPLQRRRLSSFKDAKKLKHNVVKNTRTTGSADSLDAEDIFDLEGDLSGNGNNSDADDYGSDNSGSNDEGVLISGRGRNAPSMHIARSMPMNVPKFSQHMNSRPHAHDDEEETQDIAASIKALARSVHGDVFGDLPRPRFSTQM